MADTKISALPASTKPLADGNMTFPKAPPFTSVIKFLL